VSFEPEIVSVELDGIQLRDLSLAEALRQANG